MSLPSLHDTSRFPVFWYRFLLRIRWGAWALIALYFSVLSGLVVALQYDYATPLYSTAAIDVLLPYGAFFRSLHFYTSQFFFLFTCFHFVVVIADNTVLHLSEWFKLVTTIPLILLLLFTGYILRGDTTGVSASAIAESIISSIPLVGALLDSIFLSLESSGLRRVYLFHVLGLDLALLVLLWQHLRVYRVRLSEFVPLCLLMLVFSVWITAPMDPEAPGITYISGPWFFLGLQELLRYFYPFFAGIVVPLGFLALLYALHPSVKIRRACASCLLGFLAVYCLLSLVAYYR